MNILLSRLKALCESQHLTIQFAFRSDKGCNYGEYTSKHLHGTVYWLNSNLYFFNVDINIYIIFPSIKNVFKAFYLNTTIKTLGFTECEPETDDENWYCI